MTPRETQIIDAAIRVLGSGGARAVTHRSVDAAAGVPDGSTSNYFRTRQSLIAAIVSRFAEREKAEWESITAGAAPNTPAELAFALSQFLQSAVGPARPVTAARFAIFVEAAMTPDLQTQVGEGAATLRDWAAGRLEAIGSTAPAAHAELLFNQLDGILLHQLAFPDPDFQPLPTMTAFIDSMLPTAARPG